MKVQFDSYNLLVNKKKYINNRIAIQLIDTEDGCPFCMATINMSDTKINSDEVAIKDYSENSGMLDVLVNAKIVSKPIRYIQSGFIEVPICKILI